MCVDVVMRHPRKHTPAFASQRAHERVPAVRHCHRARTRSRPPRSSLPIGRARRRPSSNAAWPIDSVPGKPACSPADPYASGRGDRDVASGAPQAGPRARPRCRCPSTIGRCGPCCSVDPIGTTSTVVVRDGSHLRPRCLTEPHGSPTPAVARASSSAAAGGSRRTSRGGSRSTSAPLRDRIRSRAARSADGPGRTRGLGRNGTVRIGMEATARLGSRAVAHVDRRAREPPTHGRAAPGADRVLPPSTETTAGAVSRRRSRRPRSSRRSASIVRRATRSNARRHESQRLRGVRGGQRGTPEPSRSLGRRSMHRTRPRTRGAGSADAIDAATCSLDDVGIDLDAHGAGRAGGDGVAQHRVGGSRSDAVTATTSTFHASPIRSAHSSAASSASDAPEVRASVCTSRSTDRLRPTVDPLHARGDHDRTAVTICRKTTPCPPSG